MNYINKVKALSQGLRFFDLGDYAALYSANETSVDTCGCGTCQSCNPTVEIVAPTVDCSDACAEYTMTDCIKYTGDTVTGVISHNQLLTDALHAIAAAIKLIQDTKSTEFSLPIYADNAAALGGGLIYGDLYMTATGEVRIVYRELLG